MCFNVTFDSVVDIGHNDLVLYKYRFIESRQFTVRFEYPLASCWFWLKNLRNLLLVFLFYIYLWFFCPFSGNSGAEGIIFLGCPTVCLSILHTLLISQNVLRKFLQIWHMSTWTQGWNDLDFGGKRSKFKVTVTSQNLTYHNSVFHMLIMTNWGDVKLYSDIMIFCKKTSWLVLMLQLRNRSLLPYFTYSWILNLWLILACYLESVLIIEICQWLEDVCVCVKHPRIRMCCFFMVYQNRHEAEAEGVQMTVVVQCDEALYLYLTTARFSLEITQLKRTCQYTCDAAILVFPVLLLVSSEFSSQLNLYNRNISKNEALSCSIIMAHSYIDWFHLNWKKT